MGAGLGDGRVWGWGWGWGWYLGAGLTSAVAALVAGGASSTGWYRGGGVVARDDLDRFVEEEEAEAPDALRRVPGFTIAIRGGLEESLITTRASTGPSSRLCFRLHFPLSRGTVCDDDDDRGSESWDSRPCNCLSARHVSTREASDSAVREL